MSTISAPITEMACMTMIAPVWPESLLATYRRLRYLHHALDCKSATIESTTSVERGSKMRLADLVLDLDSQPVVSYAKQPEAGKFSFGIQSGGMQAGVKWDRQPRGGSERSTDELIEIRLAVLIEIISIHLSVMHISRQPDEISDIL